MIVGKSASHLRNSSVVMNNPSILDEPIDPRNPKYYWWGAVSLLALAIGVVMQMFGIQFWYVPVLLGAVSISARNLTLLLYARSRIQHWFYFFGRIALISGVLMYYFRIKSSSYLIIVAFVCFAGGLLFLLFSKKDTGIDPDDEEN
jgi:hypothetical protein